MFAATTGRNARRVEKALAETHSCTTRTILAKQHCLLAVCLNQTKMSLRKSYDCSPKPSAPPPVYTSHILPSHPTYFEHEMSNTPRTASTAHEKGSLLRDTPTTPSVQPTDTDDGPETDGAELEKQEQKQPRKSTLVDQICFYLFIIILITALLTVIMGVTYAIVNDLRKQGDRAKQHKEDERQQLEDFKKQQEVFKGLQGSLLRYVARGFNIDR
jgi:hypothetical protein